MAKIRVANILKVLAQVEDRKQLDNFATSDRLSPEQVAGLNISVEDKILLLLRPRVLGIRKFIAVLTRISRRSIDQYDFRLRPFQAAVCAYAETGWIALASAGPKEDLAVAAKREREYQLGDILEVVANESRFSFALGSFPKLLK